MSAVTQEMTLSALHCLGEGDGSHDPALREELRPFIVERSDKTLRDEFALAALPVFLADYALTSGPMREFWVGCARMAYAAHDASMAAREASCAA